VTEYNAIIVDLDRCVGCYACEIACRKENNLPEGEAWIRVNEIGPQIVDGRLARDFVISIAQNCTFCEGRLKKGLEPACVSSCPTKALSCHNSHELLSDIKESRMQVLSLEKEYRDG